jgi:hypothetical protein
MRHSETLTNNEYVERIRDLEAKGAGYFTVKVLSHSSGYQISYAIHCDEPTGTARLPLHNNYGQSSPASTSL